MLVIPRLGINSRLYAYRLMRDLDDLFAALKQSRFRQRFRLNVPEQHYLHSKGLQWVLGHGRVFIAQRLAPAHPHNDGQQTPWRGHPVFIAQHATATCCRSCLQQWHDIAQGQALTLAEQDYVLEVLKTWLSKQSSLPAPVTIKQLDLFANDD